MREGIWIGFKRHLQNGHALLNCECKMNKLNRWHWRFVSFTALIDFSTGFFLSLRSFKLSDNTESMNQIVHALRCSHVMTIFFSRLSELKHAPILINNSAIFLSKNLTISPFLNVLGWNLAKINDSNDYTSMKKY